MQNCRVLCESNHVLPVVGWLTYHKVQLGKVFMRRKELFSSPSGLGDMRLGMIYPAAWGLS